MVLPSLWTSATSFECLSTKEKERKRKERKKGRKKVQTNKMNVWPSLVPGKIWSLPFFLGPFRSVSVLLGGYLRISGLLQAGTSIWGVSTWSQTWVVLPWSSWSSGTLPEGMDSCRSHRSGLEGRLSSRSRGLGSPGPYAIPVPGSLPEPGSLPILLPWRAVMLIYPPLWHGVFIVACPNVPCTVIMYWNPAVNSCIAKLEMIVLE